MQFLWKYIDDLVGKGLEWNVISELLFYAALVLVPMAMPLAVLLASIMTFGNLGESNELFAMKSGGISLYKIMFPLFIFCTLISIGSYLFADHILPYTNLKMRALLMSIQQQRPEINIQNGIFSEPVEYFSIKANKNNKTGLLKNILIYDHRSQSKNTNVTTAEQGTMKITNDKTLLILDLKNGYRFEEVVNSKSSQQYQRSKYKHQTLYIPLDGLGLDRNNEDFFKNNFDMINNSQIFQAVDSLKDNLNTRYYNVCKNIVAFYSFKLLPNRDLFISDTARQRITPFQVDYIFDSIYNSLTKEQKKIVLDRAITDYRSIKINIEIMQEEAQSNLRWIVRHEIEWHRKYVFAIACLLFYVIGASVGSIIRKGGFGVPVIISMVFFLLYYIISIAFENTIRELVIDSAIGMWFATYILIPIAIFLTIKAANESLGIRSYTEKLLKKFKVKLKRSDIFSKKKQYEI